MNKLLICILLLFTCTSKAANPPRNGLTTAQNKQIIDLNDKIRKSLKAIPEIAQIIPLQKQLNDEIEKEKNKTKLIDIEERIKKSTAAIADETTGLMNEIITLRKDRIKNDAQIKEKQNKIMELRKKAGLEELQQQRNDAQQKLNEQMLKNKTIQDLQTKIDHLVSPARLKIKKSGEIQKLRRQIKELK